MYSSRASSVEVMPEVVAGIDRQRIAEMVAADAGVHIEALMTEIDIGCDQRTVMGITVAVVVAPAVAEIHVRGYQRTVGVAV